MAQRLVSSGTWADTNGSVKAPAASVNGSEDKLKPVKFRSKYKHVEAAHKIARPSVLSHDSTEVPSFLGFRNLMVLTISECSRLSSPSTC